MSSWTRCFLETDPFHVPSTVFDRIQGHSGDKIVMQQQIIFGELDCSRATRVGRRRYHVKSDQIVSTRRRPLKRHHRLRSENGADFGRVHVRIFTRRYRTEFPARFASRVRSRDVGVIHVTPRMGVAGWIAAFVSDSQRVRDVRRVRRIHFPGVCAIPWLTLSPRH